MREFKIEIREHYVRKDCPSFIDSIKEELFTLEVYAENSEGAYQSAIDYLDGYLKGRGFEDDGSDASEGTYAVWARTKKGKLRVFSAFVPAVYAEIG